MISTVESSRFSARRSPLLGFAVVGWLVLIVSGYAWLLRYQNTPGGSAKPPEALPTGSSLRDPSEKMSLLLFTHPKCPCSRASLDELAYLLDRSGGKASAKVVFVIPPAAPMDWERHDLWTEVSRMKGVEAVVDRGGRQARLFGAKTSGQLIAYDGRGVLLYSGGITESRGHRGDYPGRRSILDRLNGAPSPGSGDDLLPTSGPVFGCPLFNEQACDECGGRST